MFNVALIGHSNLRDIADESGRWYFQNFVIEVFCCPAATTSNIASFPEYNRLFHKNFDIVILLLGGNDIRNNCNISEIYRNLKALVEDINNLVIPKYGTFLLEPEARRGDSRYVSEKGYYRLRNSLVRKIKIKKEIECWTLVGKGLNLNHLKKDGVHLNKEGRRKFKKIIEAYLIEIVTAKKQDNKERPKVKRCRKTQETQPGPSTSGGSNPKISRKYKNRIGKSLKNNLKERKETKERETSGNNKGNQKKHTKQKIKKD